ncbi:MAG: cysteine desulfurase [Desulfobacteraceae bacterium]|nr:cysteine desulfurase [Desulfobacteraceae bacterium]
MKLPIYLDYNGTTPHDPEVIEAMRPFFETEFGNPSSSHWYGIAPKQAVERARGQVAGLLGCSPGEVVFTSGGTESNNQAVKSFGGAKAAEGSHIVTTRIEHPAILEPCRFMETHGFSVTYLPVDETGRVSVSDVEDALRADTVLITVMHANNEVGTVQPVAEIAEVAKRKGILFHTDAAQSLGKIPVDVDSLGVELLSMAGHKLYAPKGVGALYVRGGMSPKVFCHGAGQERGLRAGTENVLEIVGLGKACEVAARDLAANGEHLAAMRDRLEAGLRSALGDLRFNGHPEQRLPNTCSVSFRGLEAGRILEEIGLEVAASAGAACHADRVEISHVLEAMSIPEEWAKGTLRFTTGKMTTAAEIDGALEVVVSAVNKLRRAPRG